ncbi:hypothetical protein CC79DRAFT_1331447 [Sarocladium strictum]
MSDIVQTSNFDLTTTASKASFLQLPSELRNTIYELLLLHLEPIDPVYPDPLGLTTGLFRVCKAIHHEATSLLYSRNRFDFTVADPEKLTLFFEKIGSRNAGCVRDILIRFPEFHNLEPGNVTLDEGSISMLMTLQSSCANLSKVATCLQSTVAMENRLDNLDNFNTATEALELVNIHFKAIPSIREIVLHVYEDGTGVQLRQRMTEYNWELSTTPYLSDEVYEYWGRDFSDDDYDNDYGYDEAGYDDYDIDNDSDFWRRAAD